MKQQERSWDDDIERLILFADIMGFKDRVMRTRHIDLKHTLVAFKEEWSRKMSPFKLGDHLRFSQYSDSIVIVVNGVDNRSLNLISKAGTCLVQTSLKAGLPIKGAIAKGQFTYDESHQIFFGQPLVDAYLLQDEIKFYGIVAHHTIEHLIKNSKPDIARMFAKTDVPLEKGWSKHYILSWEKINNNSFHANGIELGPWLDSIEENISGKPRVYVDNTIKVMDSIKTVNHPSN